MYKNNIWKYYLFNFLKEFALFSAVLVPFFTQWGNISLFKVQILQSWFMFWIFLLEVPTGAIADYFGRKISLILGSIVIALGVLVYGNTPRFEMFLLGEFILATGFALISGADQALLFDSLKEDKKEVESKKIFGKAHAFNLLGIFISAPLGSFAASKLGLNAPMYLTAIPFFLAAIVALSFKEPIIKEKTSEAKRYLDVVKKGFFYFKNHKILRLLAIDAILVNSAAYFVIWLYQPLFMSIKVPISSFGWFHALLIGTEILIASNFVRLEKIIGSGKKYLQFSAIITAIMFFITAAVPNIFTIISFIIFAGGFGLTRFELMSSYMNKFIPSESRATILSSISMFKRFTLIFLNPLIGFTADHSLRLALVVIGILPLLIFLFYPISQEILDSEN